MIESGTVYEHYSDRPLRTVLSGALLSSTQPWRRSPYKPHGLWISVPGEQDWPTWCRSESYNLKGLKFRHVVTLHASAIVLLIRTLAELDAFANEHGCDNGIDWPAVAVRWQGVIIAPYQWERRLALHWYYGWDCASGCIWDPAAIQRVELLEATPA